MRRTLPALGIALLVVPAPADAWGFEAHKFIVDHAIRLLPPALKPLFEANRAMVIERSIDPDTWREVYGEIEGPNHYLDIDWEGYGPSPFVALPRDYGEAVQKL